MAVRIKLQRGALRKLEASLRAGGRALTEQLHKVLIDDVHKWAKGIIRAIESDSRFNELRTSEDLRGVLGMPLKRFRKGGDTDADDLIKLLHTYRVTSSATLLSKKINVVFPTIKNLEEELVRSLSTIDDKGVVTAGPRKSWFSWWEFGDRGEITSLTVLRRTVGKLAAAKGSGQTKGRSNLLRLIRDRSRSGAALQIAGIPANASSRVEARGLVGEKYRNFAKIFPARMGKTMRNYVRRNKTKVVRLFTRARIR
jgi:hypothetical protein